MRPPNQPVQFDRLSRFPIPATSNYSGIAGLAPRKKPKRAINWSAR
jgi:hypothetical protein